MAKQLLSILEPLVDYKGVKAALIDAINNKVYGEIYIENVSTFTNYDRMIAELTYQLDDKKVFTDNDCSIFTRFKLANIGNEFVLECENFEQFLIYELRFLAGKTFSKITYSSSDITIIMFDIVINDKLRPRGIMFTGIYDAQWYINSIDLQQVCFAAGCDGIIDSLPNLRGIITDNAELKTDATIIIEPDMSKHEQIYREQFCSRTKSARN